MRPKGILKCNTSGCWREPKYIFISKRSGRKIGYCEKHYGDGKWLERQKLFPKERYYMVVRKLVLEEE